LSQATVLLKIQEAASRIPGSQFRLPRTAAPTLPHSAPSVRNVKAKAGLLAFEKSPCRLRLLNSKLSVGNAKGLQNLVAV